MHIVNVIVFRYCAGCNGISSILCLAHYKCHLDILGGELGDKMLYNKMSKSLVHQLYNATVHN